MGEVGKDFWRSFCAIPTLEQVTQDHVQIAFEYLQGGGLQNFPGHRDFICVSAFAEIIM